MSGIPHFDLVHAADPRFRGGTASALRAELIAAHRWGLRSALLPYLGMQERPALDFAPRLRDTIAALGFPLLSPDSPSTCEILLAHHPYVFRNLPETRPRLQPHRIAAVLHHPPFDGRHVAQYDPLRVLEVLETSYSGKALLAPVSAVIRHQLIEMGIPEGKLLRHDLPNIVDETEWPLRNRPAPQGNVIIGRHSRNDPLKWPVSPEDICAAWPDRPGISVRILGEAHLPGGMTWPRNWHVRPFTEYGVAEFLSGLDFYVYFHSTRWIEAFGVAIAEAMATGLVTILPPEFRNRFGDGAVYCRPDEVSSVIDRFVSQPDEYTRQSRAGRRFILQNHSVASYHRRLVTLCEDLDSRIPMPLKTVLKPEPLPRNAPHVMPPGPAHTRVLMVAGNGIGLGHITRLMAIARYLPPWIEPVFLTQSLATRLVREAGYAADYIPSFTKSGVTEDSWNKVFALELLSALNATGARGVVFDSNHPFPGLLSALDLRPDLSWIWVRRGLWQPHHRLDPERNKCFDLVLEPGEIARAEDAGPTAGLPRVVPLAPVLLTEPGDLLPREEAARALSLDPGATNVALQLGGRQNSDFGPIRNALLQGLARHDVRVIEVRNPLAPPPEDEIVETRTIYPLARHARALDLLITTPGYNAFHESLFHRIPTLFVPNEAPEMDHQLLRARFAEIAGYAACLRQSDLPRAEAILSQALDPRFRAACQDRANGLPPHIGARQAAIAIAEQLASVRSNRELAYSLPFGA